jgi:anti-sigma-K factor RskA
MTGPPITPEERARLAGEYALGVLEGEDLGDARALAGRDPEFRAEVARWRGRLVPLLDEVAPVAPPERAWQRIDAAIGTPAVGGDNVVVLRWRVNVWRGTAAAASALAAALAIVLAVQPRLLSPSPVERVAPAPPLVAMVGDDQQMKLMASWDPVARRLVLAVAGDMPADARHSHELWVIPAGGKPRSLGTMPGKKQMHMSLEQTLAELMRQGATIAISVEPPGGSPTGAPTGPVIASGMLRTA